MQHYDSIMDSVKNPPHVTIAVQYILSHFSGVPSECMESAPTDDKHLAWMLSEIADNQMSETKANRWLGYVQGVMVMKGIISVEDERERTRPIFNGA